MRAFSLGYPLRSTAAMTYRVGFSHATATPSPTASPKELQAPMAAFNQISPSDLSIIAFSSMIEKSVRTVVREELETSILPIKKDIASLKTDVAGLKTDVAGLKTDVGSLKTGQRLIWTALGVSGAALVTIALMSEKERSLTKSVLGFFVNKDIFPTLSLPTPSEE